MSLRPQSDTTAQLELASAVSSAHQPLRLSLWLRVMNRDGAVVGMAAQGHQREVLGVQGWELRLARCVEGEVPEATSPTNVPLLALQLNIDIHKRHKQYATLYLWSRTTRTHPSHLSLL
jgi:hypothetical protein